MSFWTRIKRAAAALTSTGSDPQPWLLAALGGGKSVAGVTVSPATALQVAAVFACVRIISESLAQLPLVLYQRNGREKQRAFDHPLYPLLHDAPAENLTSLEWREMSQAHLCLRGNSYSLIERDSRGRVGEVLGLHSDEVTPKATDDRRQMFYDIRGIGENLPARRLLHLRGLTVNGLVGLSPIQEGRNAVGLAIAGEQFGGRQFETDATPPAVLEVDANLDQPQVKALRDSWNEQHRLKNEIAILHSGMKYKQIGLNNEDLQFLESRKFQITEIARLFRVPPHMIADLEKATFSNIEHQGIEFVIHTLAPWVKRWEQRLMLTLLTPAERARYEIKFLLDGLLRGDTGSRYEAYAKGRQWGWLSPNDIREKEDMNPIEGGDVYESPLNMAELGENRASATD